MLQLPQPNISAISALVCSARHNNVINTLEHNSKSDIRPLAKIPSLAAEMVNKMCTILKLLLAILMVVMMLLTINIVVKLWHVLHADPHLARPAVYPL